RPQDLELVLTGRWAPKEIMERADLVTEVRMIKHYFSKGVPAREGIEK
ncbi:MAG: cob(I)yrinic acid a,c-diamide adenosyltransferase, partial [Deltaproteobacteria bacterium]|nr:cob(I)yrinic acid a,c-diamide adenosyltransferase [Deltaproteobacteria bacterium]MBW1963931.1 cob(I)yrinic acid a,c-diamide adenosyltransferase [Deltaproteobacteria bacterium]